MKPPRFRLQRFGTDSEATVYLDGLQVGRMGVTEFACYYDHTTRSRSLTAAEVIVLASIMEAVEELVQPRQKDD